MDTIFLNEIKVETKLGVPEWERMVPQTILLDIEIVLANEKSSRTDNIKDTVDYGVVVARIRETLAENSFKLVEALAEHVCQLILKEFGVPWVKIKVAKPGILPGVKTVGMTMERGVLPT